MKVIFLDVDGVLNTDSSLRRHGSYSIDVKCLRVLGLVVRATKAKLVISSSWRGAGRYYNFLCDHLAQEELLTEVIGQTPEFYTDERHTEIAAWLEANSQTERYAILDDFANASNDTFQSSFFQTNGKYGLTAKIGDAIIQHLNSEIPEIPR